MILDIKFNKTTRLEYEDILEGVTPLVIWIWLYSVDLELRGYQKLRGNY